MAVSRVVKSDMKGIYIQHMGYKCRFSLVQDHTWVHPNMLREGVILAVLDTSIGYGGIRVVTRLNATKIYWDGTEEAT